MRVAEYFDEVHLPLDLVWQPFSDVGRWPTFDQYLTEVHTEGYETFYVRFKPRFYLWNRMRLEWFSDEGKLALVGKLPKARVRTSFSLRRSLKGTLIHTHIRFSGGLSFLWAGLLMLPYRHRVRLFVDAWIAEVERIGGVESHDLTREKVTNEYRFDGSSPVKPPQAVPDSSVAQID